MGKRKTTEQFIKEARKVHKDKYNYDKTEYTGAHKKLKIYCKTCNEYFLQTPTGHLNKRGCSTCGIELNAKNSTKTKEHFIKKAKEIHGDKYNYSEVDYINSKSNVRIYCKTCNDFFTQRASNHTQGLGCPVCGVKASGRKTHNQEEVIEKFKKVHGDKYNYDKVEYVGVREKVKIYCKTCNEYFLQTPSSHQRGIGCPTCGAKKIGDKNRKTKEQFIKESIEIHGSKYSYDKVEYVNANTKVKIYCNTCNDFFLQEPSSHQKGSGCNICGTKKTGDKNRKTREQFIKEAIEIHKDKYDYSEVDYMNKRTKVKIYCKTCNEYFSQIPNNHLQNNGCNSCGIKVIGDKNRKTKEQFIKEAIEIHGDKYDYDKVEYKNTRLKVKIYCKTCNEFFTQNPHNHLNSKGCPSCSKSGYKQNQPGQLYYFEIPKQINKTKFSYYKIGITNKTIEKRYNNIDKQKFGRIKTWDFEDGEIPRDIEQTFLNKYNWCKYDYKENGDMLESGNTEIFLVDILPDLEKHIQQQN